MREGVAESLSEVILSVSADTTALQAGLNEAKKLAQEAGSDIARKLNARQTALEALEDQRKAILAQKNANPWKSAEYDRLIKALQTEIALRRQSLGILDQQLKKEKERAGIQLPDRAVGAYGKIATTLAGLGAGFALQQFFRESIAGAVELESITKKLSNTLGEQGAGKALAFTKGLADQLGLSFTTLASSFGSFTAAASAASVPLETQRELFAAVSRAAQQLGLSNDEIGGSLLALQQIASKGTVQMEELRGQLGERLPIAFGAAARGMGLTQQELIKMIELGRLTADEFFPALTKGLNELTSASAGAPTAAQNFQILENKWKELQVAFGQDLLPVVTQSVKGLIAAVEGLGRKGLADRLGFGTGLVGGLGFLSDQAITAAEGYKLVQKELNLTDREADRLFSNAAKNLGVKNVTFADLETVNEILGEYGRLARGFREANPDRQDELSRQNALAEKLRQSALARADAEQKILKPSEQRLRDLQRLAGLEGLALESAQQALKLEEARRKQSQAQDAYSKVSDKISDGVESPALIDAAAKLEAAGNGVKAAMLEGAQALTAAAKDFADRFTAAVEALTNARLNLAETQADPNGLNRFLRPDEQFQRTRSSIISLGPEFQRALEQGQKLLNAQGVGLGRPVFQELTNIFDNAVTGRGASQEGLQQIAKFIRDVQAEQGAVRGVNTAQENLTRINEELVTVNGSLVEQVRELVSKNWAVEVNVTSNGAAQVLGDVAGAIS